MRKRNMTIEEHFEYWHNNPPAPFNPDYDPAAAQAGKDIAREMEAEGFYATHTREECAAELRRRTLVEREVRKMLKEGKATLYLTMDQTYEKHIPSERCVAEGWRMYVYGPVRRQKSFYAKKIKVEGAHFSTVVQHMTIGRHNMADKRYDVWFNVDNEEKGIIEQWHGISYGDNTQTCHCKRTKNFIPIANRPEPLSWEKD